MTDFAFPPAPQPRLPIAGRTEVFPVHRIFCVGRNYVAHAEEMGGTVDRAAPWYFTKSSHHIHGGGTVPFAVGTDDYHHEVELTVAIGQSGQDLATNDALSIVFGHAVGLDMTRRDVQAVSKANRRPWCTAKDVQAGAVIGPIMQATDGVPAPTDRITLTLNGSVVQDAPLSDMVWSVAELISHLSHLYTLQPGDLIMTGTPAGVGPVSRNDHVVARCADLPVLEARFE